jgi:hypothetical protein
MSIERIALILLAAITLGLAVAQTGQSQGFGQGGLPVPSPPMGMASPVMVSGPNDRVWITQGDKLWACKLSEAGKIGCEGFSLAQGR